MSKFIVLKINNSKNVSIKSGKWKDPGAKLYDQLLNAAYFPNDNVDDPNNQYTPHYLKEAYLIAPVSKIKYGPYGQTPYSSSGCKYPHHTIHNGELIVHETGLKAAYGRAKQMGIFTGEVKEHLERHYKELGLYESSTMQMNESMEENFDSIMSFILESTSSKSMKDLKSLFDSIITPKDLLLWMIKNIQYGYMDKKTKKGIVEYEDNDFVNKYFIETPEQLLESGAGTCFDQTEFERRWFQLKEINHRVFYMEDKMTSNDQPCHSTLLYEMDGEIFWFEHSWSNQKGIKEFASWEEAIKDITNTFTNQNNQDDKVGETIITELETLPPFSCNCFQYMEWASNQKKVIFGKDIYEEAVYYMNDIDQFIAEQVFEEKSQGKLKSSFRYGVNPDNGHRIKIVFDLDPKDVKFIGHHFDDKDTTVDKNPDRLKKINRVGNNDFVSAATVKAIIDEDTGSKLQSVRLIGSLNSYLNNVRSFVEPKGSHIWNVCMEDHGKESFEINTLRLRELMVKSPNWNPPSSDIQINKLGQKETNATYKATRPGDRVEILKNMNSDHRRANFNARGVNVGADKINKEVMSLFNDFKVLVRAANKINMGVPNQKILDEFKKDFIKDANNAIDHCNAGEVNKALSSRNGCIHERNEMRKFLDFLQSPRSIKEGFEMTDDLDWMEKYLTEAEEPVPPVTPVAPVAPAKPEAAEPEKVEPEAPKPVEPEKKESMPKKTDKAESSKNGVRRKQLYIAFINWAKGFNPKNTFGSVFDKDAFHSIYPFVPDEMRYFYRLANPMLCVLSGDLTFFAVAELRKLNMKNSRLSEMMIFAATNDDVRVFNKKDKKVYRGTEENGMLKLAEILGDDFDAYIQKMVNQGDILHDPIVESADMALPFISAEGWVYK